LPLELKVEHSLIAPAYIKTQDKAKNDEEWQTL